MRYYTIDLSVELVSERTKGCLPQRTLLAARRALDFGAHDGSSAVSTRIARQHEDGPAQSVHERPSSATSVFARDLTHSVALDHQRTTAENGFAIPKPRKRRPVCRAHRKVRRPKQKRPQANARAYRRSNRSS